MDGSNPCANAISGDIAASVYNSGCDSQIDYKKSLNSVGEHFVVPSSIGEKEGKLLNRTCCPHDLALNDGAFGGKSCALPIVPCQVEKLDPQDEDRICQEFLHSVSLDVKKQKTLCKSATFPCSLDMQPDSGNEPSSGEEECSLADNSVYSRSVSLPTGRLVSAMKGSRERNGLALDMKLHVKWAPDVYDPPVTLMSHTVRKNHHHQRSKPKKKDNNKHKRNKTKSSRGTAEKRTAGNSNLNKMIEPLDLRLEKDGNRSLMPDMSNLKHSWNMELPLRNLSAEVAF